ncbi:MAG: ribose-phosphate diphosphokinase [Candidatus Dojkabacteria bacterium]
MLVFSINTSDLATNLLKLPNFKKGQFKLKQFADGEWYARVTSGVKGNRTAIIGNTTAPADNIVKLTLLVNALRHADARSIDLIIPYFGYQKQDTVVEPGEAVSAEAMAVLLRAIKPDRLICNALHSGVTRRLLKSKLTEITPEKLLASEIKKLKLRNMVVASPDKGSLKRDLLLANELGEIPTICAEKRELSPRSVLSI